jgi:hypothetical protein
MAKSETQSRLYACCAKADCQTYLQLLDFLKVWGLPTVPQKDGSKTFFDVTIPSHWNKSRCRTFAKGLNAVKTKH